MAQGPPRLQQKTSTIHVWAAMAINDITYVIDKPKCRFGHFMQIGDNSHEMSNLVSGKNKKKYFKMFAENWCLALSGQFQQTTYCYDAFLIFSRKQNLTFLANCLCWRQFAWNVKSCLDEGLLCLLIYSTVSVDSGSCGQRSWSDHDLHCASYYLSHAVGIQM